MLNTLGTALLYVHLALAQAPGGTYTPRISQGYGNWSDAYAKAQAFVCGLTLTEKVNLTTSVGSGASNSYSLGIIPRVGFRGFALDDSPSGVRGADYSSAFAAGLNLAMSWDRELMYIQNYANGAEHKAKGVNLVFAPVSEICRFSARLPLYGFHATCLFMHIVKHYRLTFNLCIHLWHQDSQLP